MTWYLSLMPRSIVSDSATLGSGTITGWNLRGARLVCILGVQGVVGAGG